MSSSELTQEEIIKLGYFPISKEPIDRSYRYEVEKALDYPYSYEIEECIVCGRKFSRKIFKVERRRPFVTCSTICSRYNAIYHGKLISGLFYVNINRREETLLILRRREKKVAIRNAKIEKTYASIIDFREKFMNKKEIDDKVPIIVQKYMMKITKDKVLNKAREDIKNDIRKRLEYAKDMEISIIGDNIIQNKEDVLKYLVELLNSNRISLELVNNNFLREEMILSMVNSIPRERREISDTLGIPWTSVFDIIKRMEMIKSCRVRFKVGRGKPHTIYYLRVKQLDIYKVYTI